MTMEGAAGAWRRRAYLEGYDAAFRRVCHSRDLARRLAPTSRRSAFGFVPRNYCTESVCGKPAAGTHA
jgi:hypothetical protein